MSHARSRKLPLSQLGNTPGLWRAFVLRGVRTFASTGCAVANACNGRDRKSQGEHARFPAPCQPGSGKTTPGSHQLLCGAH